MLITNWQEVLKRAWSVRWIVLAGVRGSKSSSPLLMAMSIFLVVCWPRSRVSQLVPPSSPESSFRKVQLILVYKIAKTKRGKSAIAELHKNPLSEIKVVGDQGDP